MQTARRCIFYITIFFLPLLLFILTGCASSVTQQSKGGAAQIEETRQQQENTEQIKNVKISSFIIGVGDSIDITVYRNDDLKKSVKIDSSGRIMFPLIGDVQAAGKDIFQLRDEMQKKLSKYLVDPQVSINVSAVQSQKVMVLGEVNNPGILTLDSDTSVMEAISKTGGMTQDAKLSNVLLIRKGSGKPTVAVLDLNKAFKEGDLSQNMALQGGDIVYLPAVMIADVSWFFEHLSKILSPIVSLESGIVLWPQVKDVLQGTTTGGTTIIPTR